MRETFINDYDYWSTPSETNEARALAGSVRPPRLLGDRMMVSVGTALTRRPRTEPGERIFRTGLPRWINGQQSARRAMAGRQRLFGRGSFAASSRAEPLGMAFACCDTSTKGMPWLRRKTPSSQTSIVASEQARAAPSRSRRSLPMRTRTCNRAGRTHPASVAARRSRASRRPTRALSGAP